MSDIIYTPPASSGGGQNPTTNYIPVNNGTSSFVDSDIQNVIGQYLYAISSGTGLYLSFYVGEFILGGGDYGFKCENFNENFYMGDYGYSSSGTFILVENFNEVIKTFNQGQEKGLRLDFTNNIYQLGFPNGNGNYIEINDNNNTISLVTAINSGNSTTLLIDDNNYLIKTSGQGNDIGLKLDFANKNYILGDWNDVNNGTRIYLANKFISINASGIGNGTELQLDDDTQLIQTFLGAGEKGIKLNNILKSYSFGDFNNVDSGTSFIIDDASTKMTFNTQFLNFVGAGLQSNTASGNSGKHLVITLNGIQYKLALLNP